MTRHQSFSFNYTHEKTSAKSDRHIYFQLGELLQDSFSDDEDVYQFHSPDDNNTDNSKSSSEDEEYVNEDHIRVYGVPSQGIYNPINF